MYSTTTQGTSPMQLIEKAHSFSEDDDLLSPYDTGEVEKQMKRAWWKTCSLFTFLLATLGIIMFIVIRDNNTSHTQSSKNQININQKFATKPQASANSPTINNNNNKNNKDNNYNTNDNNNNNNNIIKRDDGLDILSMRNEVASNVIGPRVTLRELYNPDSKECATSMMNVFIENGELSQDRLILDDIESGFKSILDEFGSLSMKKSTAAQEFLSKSSQFGYYSDKLNKEFDVKSLTVNAKSDALVFVITINWESMFGNKLPYTTSRVVTLKYDSKPCQITTLMPISFTECFNGKCSNEKEKESNVIEYLRQLVEDKRQA